MSSQELDALFQRLEKAQAERRLPPVQDWHPQHSGTIDIVIRADGTWLHEGGAFRRQALVRLFSTVMRREGDRYFLVTPAEKLEITVEDAPFVALDFERRGEGDAQELIFTINSGDHVVADAAHALWIEADRPYLHVRDGLHALISRPAFYRLMDLARQDADGWCITSRGTHFALG